MLDTDRRNILKLLSAAGIGSAVFGRALVALAADAPKVTGEMLAQAEWISGIKLTDEQRKLVLEGMNEAEGQLRQDARGRHRQRGAAGVHVRSRTWSPRRRSPRRRRSPCTASKGKPAPLPSNKDDIAYRAGVAALRVASREVDLLRRS